IAAALAVARRPVPLARRHLRGDLLRDEVAARREGGGRGRGEAQEEEKEAGAGLTEAVAATLLGIRAPGRHFLSLAPCPPGGVMTHGGRRPTPVAGPPFAFVEPAVSAVAGTAAPKKVAP